MISYNKVVALNNNKNFFSQNVQHTSFKQQQEKIQFDEKKRTQIIDRVQLIENRIATKTKKELPLRQAVETLELKIRHLGEKLALKKKELQKVNATINNDEFDLSYCICNLRVQKEITDIFSKYLPKLHFLKEEKNLNLLKEAFINATLNLEEFSEKYVLDELISNCKRALLQGAKDDFGNYISNRLSKSTIDFNKIKNELGSEYSDEDVKNIVTLAFLRLLSNKNRINKTISGDLQREPDNYREVDLKLEVNFNTAIEELVKSDKESIVFDDFIEMILTNNNLMTQKSYVQCIYQIEDLLNSNNKIRNVLSREIGIYDRIVKKNRTKKYTKFGV